MSNAEWPMKIMRYIKQRPFLWSFHYCELLRIVHSAFGIFNFPSDFPFLKDSYVCQGKEINDTCKMANEKQALYQATPVFMSLPETGRQQTSHLEWQEIDNRHYLLYIVGDWKRTFKIWSNDGLIFIKPTC